VLGHKLGSFSTSAPTVTLSGLKYLFLSPPLCSPHLSQMEKRHQTQTEVPSQTLGDPIALSSTVVDGLWILIIVALSLSALFRVSRSRVFRQKSRS
jgi:hypothetical protein